MIPKVVVSSKDSSSSRISTHSIKSIIDKLVGMQNRESTRKTYLVVWRQFNKFLVSLDYMPNDWEDRTTLFVAYLVQKGMQSGTVKSYISAIKRTLLNDGYNWKDNVVLLASLTKACKLINDKVQVRLPISCNLLEMILFEVQRVFRTSNQMYLDTLYKAIFALGYYGLFRVGELMQSVHSIKAGNVHMGTNKDKILVVLYSSKTHSKNNRPQKIKIIANNLERTGNYRQRNFCPFKLLRNYINIRGDFSRPEESFFVFRDRSPVTVEQARKVLKNSIRALGLDSNVYDMHSLRIGRASD